MYDIYAQKSNYPFKGVVYNEDRYFQKDTALTEQEGEFWVLNSGEYVKKQLPQDYENNETYYTRAETYTEVTLPSGYVQGTQYYAKRNDNDYYLVSEGTGETTTLTTDAYHKFYTKAITYTEATINAVTYKKGDVNPRFKIGGDEFMFNITSMNTRDKKQPLSDFLVHSEEMAIDTKFKHPKFKQGGYFGFNGKLWIIKTVDEEKGPQKSIYSFFSVNPLSTIKMLVEEAQE